MPRKEKNFYELNVKEYDIAGNALRVWRDENGKIIFLLDETIDEFKPNVLLVMESVGDRKWDDVLQNDYGIDLETVRPKRDNLYQKLDIEYYGLDEYNRLIDAYEDGDDIDDALRGVIEFRDAAARRAATVRLTTALDTIEQSQETLSRAEHAVHGMRERRKTLRAKLAQQRSFIGQEPTKQSASRILRVESQIESNDEKIARAEKRIENAKRRIAVAMDEAEDAREFLDRRRNNETKKNNKKEDEFEELEYKPNINLDVPNNKQELTVQPKEQDMDENEEVKPLLNQDPEILDEEIAFKPVKFDDIKSESEYDDDKDVESYENTESRERVDDDFDGDVYTNRYESDSRAEENVVRPLSFSSSEHSDDYVDSEHDYSESEGVLDTIKTVEEPVPADTDTTGHITNTQYENNNVVRPAAYNNARPVPPTSRPVSPISGTDVRPVDTKVNNRPTLAYYLLLILLIGLSVFALWLYQQKNGDSLPVLDPKTETRPVEDVEAPVAKPVENWESKQEVSVQDNSENFVEQEQDVPVVVASEDTPINIVYPNENILRAAEPAPVVVESEQDVLARKEPYNVSQHENMFVADGAENVPEPVVRETNVVSPDVIFDDDIISVPMAPNYDEEYYEPDIPVQMPTVPAGYYNNVYRQEQNYMPQPEYVPQDYYNQGYVQNDVVYEEDVPVSNTQKHLSIHDGGQYSVTYEETNY